MFMRDFAPLFDRNFAYRWAGHSVWVNTAVLAIKKEKSEFIIKSYKKILEHTISQSESIKHVFSPSKFALSLRSDRLNQKDFIIFHSVLFDPG